MRSSILTIVLIMSFFVTANAKAENVVMAFTEGAPPYTFTEDEGVEHSREGLWIDIYREALAFHGHTLEPYFTNYNRIESELNQGRVTAVALLQDRLPTLFASEDAIHFRNFVFEQPGGTTEINSLSDLAGRRLISWHGARTDLGEEFSRVVDTLSYYDELASQIAQIRFFVRRGIDFTIVDESIFRYLVRRNGADPDDYAAHDIIGGYLRFPAGFTSEAIRDDFNDGIRHLKETGRYDELYRFYADTYLD